MDHNRAGQRYRLRNRRRRRPDLSHGVYWDWARHYLKRLSTCLSPELFLAHWLPDMKLDTDRIANIIRNVSERAKTPISSTSTRPGYIFMLARHPDPSPDGQTVFYPEPISPQCCANQPWSLHHTHNREDRTYWGTSLRDIPGRGDFVRRRFNEPSTRRVRQSFAAARRILNLPVTPGAFQSVLQGNYDVFVARLNPDGSAYQALRLA